MRISERSRVGLLYERGLWEMDDQTVKLYNDSSWIILRWA